MPADPDWDAALDEWESWLGQLERALAEDDWSVIASSGDWLPPEGGMPDPDRRHVERFRALRARADALRAELVAARGETVGDIVAARKQAQVQRRYLEH